MIIQAHDMLVVLSLTLSLILSCRLKKGTLWQFSFHDCNSGKLQNKSKYQFKLFYVQ